MIISLKRRAIYIANIKVASTAIESALRADADVALVQTEQGKHLHLCHVEQRLSSLFEPDGIRSFKVFGSIRHPMRWLISIYQSHMAEQFAGTEYSSREVAFDEYINRQLDKGWDQLVPQLDRFRYSKGEVAPVNWIPMASAAEYLSNEWFAGERQIKLPAKNVSFADDPGPIRCSAAMLQKLARIYRQDMCAYLNVTNESSKARLNIKETQQFLRSGLVEFNRSLDAARDKLTDWQIVQCYRALLRRDPEGQEAIEHHRRLRTLQRVIQEIAASPEYLAVFGSERELTGGDGVGSPAAD